MSPDVKLILVLSVIGAAFNIILLKTGVIDAISRRL